MLGFLARLAGCFILAAGVAIAVADIARSLSADDLRLTTFGQSFDYVSGQAVEAAPAQGGAMVAERLDAVWAVVLQWPASPVMAGLGLVLLVLGRRRREPQLAR